MKFFSSKKCRIVVAITMSFVLLVCLGNFQMRTYANTTKTGVVVSWDGGLIETFDAPSTSAGHVSNLANGKELTILETTTGSDGRTWYKVRYPNLYNPDIIKTAYIQSDYVRVTSSTDSSDIQGGTSGLMASGTINADNVFVRNAAGTNGTTRLVSLYRGDKVEIVGQTTVNGAIWYNVTCTKDKTYYNGWTHGSYIDITYDNVDVTGDYAQHLRDIGFPESYIPNLVALHEKYPQWVFEPVKTGLDWNTVISKQSVNGRNLVQNTTDDAKKSTSIGAYDWNTNTWTIYDGSSWVAAHPDYIAYCMDPRNFLSETNIFQFEGLSYRASQNLSGVQSILNGTFMMNNVTDADGTTLNYAQAFVDIGKEVGVSPYHLASRVRQEQGVGTSALISGNYNGYKGFFNYFNVRAYGVTSAQVIENGLAYAKQQGWNTRYKSLLGGAQMLAKNYISVGQDTLYFQKFNVVNYSNLYGHQYMTNVTAAITEGQKMGNGYADKNQAFVFRIPVYTNMPETPVKFTASGNPNNYLKSLSVGGLSLTPTFKGETTSYSMVVNSDISSVTVLASPVASTSIVSGVGTHNLSIGDNVIKVNCKSKSGSIRTYTINIARLAPSETTDGKVSINSSKYKIDSVITGVEPGTTAETLLAGITASSGTLKVLNAAGEEHTGVVGTGDKVVVYEEGNLMATYDVVIYGDVNGDGIIKVNDLFAINRHVLGKIALKDVYLTAGDVNRDGVVKVNDVFALNRHILGLKLITQ